MPGIGGQDAPEYPQQQIRIAKGQEYNSKELIPLENNSVSDIDKNSNGDKSDSQILTNADFLLKNSESDNKEEYGTRMFRRLFSFKGRIRRTEYALSYIIYMMYVLPMNILEEYEISEGFAIIWMLLLVPMLWFICSQGAKRCHDRNNSGWYQIIPYYVLWLIFAEGDKGENDYGNPPK